MPENLVKKLFKALHELIDDKNIVALGQCDFKENPYLCHYTQIESLKKILESKIFYIGSAYQMNDKTEHSYVYDLAKAILVTMGIKEECIESFVDEVNSAIFDYYIWSFSANEDSQALNHYGNVALKFRTEKIYQSLTQKFCPLDLKSASSNDALVMPLKVCYNIESQVAILNILMCKYVASLCLPKKESHDIKMEVLTHFAMLSTFFKDPLYYQEEEIRLVLLKTSNDNKPHPEKIINDKRKLIANITPDTLEEIRVFKDAENRIPEIKTFLSNSEFNNVKVELTRLGY